ncbi:DUF6221 family protein [Actinomadura gamaensis]|uniref:DUF6221 family protein n=1 Tax=Actinomadura gamaensis TaxID=1763541 RepID=A0ABV9TVA9_9ACTN
MDELVEFLRARIAKDEQIARAGSGAGSGSGPGTAWKPSPPGSVSIDGPSDEAARGFGPQASGRPGFVAEAENESYAEHIARHSPARVLREVAAKRLILDEYAKAAWLLSTGHRSEAAEAAQEVRIATLRALASAYADRPAYRPEWSA